MIIKSIDGDVISLSNVGVFFNSDNQKAKYTSFAIERLLKEKNINCNILTTDEYSKDITFAIVLGGDGTILKTARFFAEYSVLYFNIIL